MEGNELIRYGLMTLINNARAKLADDTSKANTKILRYLVVLNWRSRRCPDNFSIKNFQNKDHVTVQKLNPHFKYLEVTWKGVKFQVDIEATEFQAKSEAGKKAGELMRRG